MKIRSTWNEFAKEYALPLFLEYVILAALIFAFSLFVDKGPMLEEAVMVGDEMSSPTLGRLIFGCVAFIGFFVFTAMASRAAKQSNDIRSFWCGFTAGILLWQVLGEISWHYSVDGVHFVPLENVTTLPLAIMFIVLMVYGKRHHSFDWGVWCMLLTFACNWFGHYIMLGTAPFVAQWIDRHEWNHWVSCISGLIVFFYSIGFFLFRAKTTKGRMLASLLTFIATAVFYFGMTEG